MLDAQKAGQQAGGSEQNRWAAAARYAREEQQARNEAAEAMIRMSRNPYGNGGYSGGGDGGRGRPGKVRRDFNA